MEETLYSVTVGREDDGLLLRFNNMEQLRRFRKSLDDVISDRRWCSEHGIEYINPHVRVAAQILYDEMFLLDRL